MRMFDFMPQWTLYVAAGLLGAILGSFANVCIVRLPKDESIVSPRSHCRSCDHVLSWWENIPVASYIFLLGRCRMCGARVSIRYPLVELICVGLSLLTWYFFLNPLYYLVYFCLFVVPLVIITFIDLEHRIIPNEISIPGIFVGIAVHTFLSGGVYWRAALDSVIGLVAGGGILFLVAYVYEKLRKQQGLGGGDVKLMAMLGAFFGWQGVLFILLISSVVGSVIGIIFVVILRKDIKYAIPFGPFLAFAGMIYLFLGQKLIYWYLTLFF